MHMHCEESKGKARYLHKKSGIRMFSTGNTQLDKIS